MKYNKSWLKNNLSFFLRKIFVEKTKYYIMPKFRVARDFDFDNAYSKFGNNGKFINIGAGEYFFHKKWKNYDLYEELLVSKVKHFYNYDLRDAVKHPFPESDVNIFYCSHTMEHIPSESITTVIERLYDSLKVGGVLRVVVPDADLILEAYDNQDFDFFKAYESWFKNRSSENILIEDYLVQLLATPKCRIYNEEIKHYESLNIKEIQKNRENMTNEDFLNYLTDGLQENNSSGTDHLNWFNASKMIGLLKDVGFSKVYKSAYGQSKELVMRQVPIFDETLPCLSLFIEAKK